MTAVVGVMNKKAVAIAADSAVTISGANGRTKILNKANKIFTLSKRHPVGIMIYNLDSFMSTPWETIIKVYRQQLKDKHFNKLKEYKDDFLAFLKSKNYYSNIDGHKQYVKALSSKMIIDLNSMVQGIVSKKVYNSLDERKEDFINEVGIQLDALIPLYNKPAEFCDEFVDYSFEDFNIYATNIFNELTTYYYSNNGIEIGQDNLIKIKQLVHAIFSHKSTYFLFTGLVIVGFGEEEIYPDLISLNIFGVIDGRLKYYIDDNNSYHVSNDKTSSVMPFAQKDVIETILTGIDPNLENIYNNNFRDLFDKYNDMIVNQIGNQNDQLKNAILNLDTESIVNELVNQNNSIKYERYIQPLLDAISSLAKEDLAEMAESLIYLTYLKRRMTSEEESVGGPVDVAIISKGDGFVWIKRKLYFKPELNKFFFDNYFKF